MGMTLLEMMKRFPTEEACIKYLERVRWGKETVVCPYCGHTASTHARKDGRYMCGHCNRPFSVITRTIFHKTRVPLQKWFLAIVLVLNAKKGISSYQLARDCDLNQKTAWYMAMRIRKAMASGQAPMLQGIVEIDEFYSGGKPRKDNDGGTGGSKRGRGTSKTPVLGVIERDGSAHARVSENITKETIRAFLEENVDKSATVYSDAYRSYHGIVDKMVDHRRNFVNSEGVHTNSIESFWAVVKRGIFGQFHHVKAKYLDAYLAEFCYRYNRRKVNYTFDETVQWMVATGPTL